MRNRSCISLLKSDYTDFTAISKEKSEFWQAVSQDGRFDTLRAIATNDYVFAVNEAVNNKLMYYAGVMAEESAAPKEARVIQFPKGEYQTIRDVSFSSKQCPICLCLL